MTDPQTDNISIPGSQDENLDEPNTEMQASIPFINPEARQKIVEFLEKNRTRGNLPNTNAPRPVARVMDPSKTNPGPPNSFSVPRENYQVHFKPTGKLIAPVSAPEPPTWLKAIFVFGGAALGILFGYVVKNGIKSTFNDWFGDSSKPDQITPKTEPGPSIEEIE